MIELFNLYMNNYYEKNKVSIIIFTIVSTLFIIFESVIIPYLFGNLIVNIKEPYFFIKIIIALYLLLFVLFYIKKKYERDFMPDLLTYSRNNLFSAIIDKYSENYKTLKMGSTISKINLITGYFKNYIINSISSIIPNILIASFLCIFILCINFNFGLILLIANITIFIFILYYTKSIIVTKNKTESYYYNIDDTLIDIYSSLMNTYLNNNEVKEKERIKNQQEVYNIYLKDVIDLESGLSVSLYFITLITSITSILYILYYEPDNKKKVLLIILLIYFLNSVILLSKHIPLWIQDYALVHSSKNYLKNLLNIHSNNLSTEVYNGDIEFKNVNFSYKKNKYVLKNLNMYIKDKEKVAIIGRSGSGKSTLSKVLLKFFKYEGNIKLNNIDIKKINTKYLRKKVLYANQRTILYDMSVIDNIKYGNNADSEYILKILNEYDLLEVFSGLKNGIYSDAGVQGGELSGGMQKLVIILRTILKAEESKSLVIIFDEPLSGLDAKTREKVIKLINYKSSDKTLIIITHDKEILPHMNRIIDLTEINYAIPKKNKNKK